MTIEILLNEARKDIFGDASRLLQSKISTRLNAGQCYILHLCCIGKKIHEENKNQLKYLVDKGYLECWQTNERAKNGKNIRAFKPTTLGIVSHGEMIDAFMPIVKRINTKLQTK